MSGEPVFDPTGRCPECGVWHDAEGIVCNECVAAWTWCVEQAEPEAVAKWAPAADWLNERWSAYAPYVVPVALHRDQLVLAGRRDALWLVKNRLRPFLRERMDGIADIKIGLAYQVREWKEKEGQDGDEEPANGND